MWSCLKLAATVLPTTTGWPEIVRIGTAGPNEWTSVGNHRFNATLPSLEEKTSVLIRAQWRRSDTSPLKKAVFIRTETNMPVPCRFASEPDADSATFSFAHIASTESYFIYYMPFATCEYHGGSCRSDATVKYISAYTNGSCAKFNSTILAPKTEDLRLIGNDPLLIEAVYDPRTPFESFAPMGLPMTAKEHATFLSNAPAGVAILVVPESRELPVRMKTQLPAHWLEADTRYPTFKGVAQPGENFTFQLAAIAPSVSVAITQVVFTDLIANSGGGQQRISGLRCMNLGGIDFWGRRFTHGNVTVGAGDVKSLWVAAVIPVTTGAGVYRGTATMHTTTAASTEKDDHGHGRDATVDVIIQLTVQGAAIPHGGDDDARRGTRLHWFDGREGSEMGTVPAPFTPLEVTHQTGATGDTVIAMLGKRIHIGQTGLPTNIEVEVARGTIGGSYVTTGDPPRWLQVLDKPVDLLVLGMPATAATAATIEFQPQTNMSVQWRSVTHTPNASLVVDGEVDCTGYMSFNATLTNLDSQAAAKAAVNLTVPSAEANAHFAMGLGRKGGFLQSFLKGRPPGTSDMRSWVVFDFGRNVTLDGVRVHSYGDGVHDPLHMYIQGALPLKGGGGFSWAGSNVSAFIGQASNGSEAKPVSMAQDFTFTVAVLARWWRWVVLDCHPSSLTKRSHAMIAEIEFHEAGSAEGVYMRNNGTEQHSPVLSSSGDGTPQNPAWQCVDGKVRYKSFAYGYDAVLRRDMPDPPQPQPPSPVPGTIPTATWHWDGMPASGNGDNAVWLGSTAAGLRVFLKGDDPLWQAGVPFDSRATPDPPLSWSNNGYGGVEVDGRGTIVAFSRNHSLAAAGSMSFAWSILVTPVRPYNMTSAFKERWAQLGHPGGDYTQFKNATVTVVNMHQGNLINPWINYPYLTNPAMKHAADAVHRLGMKFAVYNTMRELSDRCLELFPMISLNETLVPGTGGGADWLQEHLRTGFLAAWSDPIDTTHVYPPAQGVPNPDPLEGDRLQDAGVRVRAMSRWNNYYVSGLRQMMRDYSCDGIYLDEIAYDRVTMLRARKVLGDSGTIDHHSDCGGFSKSPATNYMELYPFINRLWYGEGFDYDTPSADYWLAEISGLPSGLSADMLRYPTMRHSHGMTRYHYRGMLVGSAFRYTSPTSPFNPRNLWALWDDFKIEESEMIGWWEDVQHGLGTVPVQLSGQNSSSSISGGSGSDSSRCNSSSSSSTTTTTSFLATVYLQRGRQALVAVADWSTDLSNYTSSLSLQCNWSALGLSPATAKLHVPEVHPFQTDNVGVFPVDHVFDVTASQGGLLVIVK